MEKAVELLKRKGIKPTVQRAGVLKLLLEEVNHYTVDEVYKRVRESMPSISQGTVYSIMELFAEKGLVQELRIDSKQVVYDPTISRHWRFMCRRCGKIFDVWPDSVDVVGAKDSCEYLVEDYKLYLYGLCKDCKNEN